MTDTTEQTCAADGCETRFTPVKPWQKFCSTKCRKAQFERDQEREVIARYMAGIGRRGGYAKAEKLRRMGQEEGDES